MADDLHDLGQRRDAIEANPEGVTDMAAGEWYPVPSEARFGSAEFLDAPDLEVLGDMLVDDLALDSAAKFTIRYLWKKTGGDHGGKCIKASGPAKHFSKADFLIWVAADHAEEGRLTLRQMRSLLYHELLHITETDLEKPAIRKHDIEIFRAELEQFGMWNPRIERTLGQLKMPLGWGSGR